MVCILRYNLQTLSSEENSVEEVTGEMEVREKVEGGEGEGEGEGDGEGDEDMEVTDIDEFTPPLVMKPTLTIPG